MKVVKYNGIAFNADYASKLSEADFVKEFSKGRPAENLDEKQSKNFARFKNVHELTDVQLKEVYQLIKADGNDQKSSPESAAIQSAAGSGKVANSDKRSNS